MGSPALHAPLATTVRCRALYRSCAPTDSTPLEAPHPAQPAQRTLSALICTCPQVCPRAPLANSQQPTHPCAWTALQATNARQALLWLAPLATTMSLVSLLNAHNARQDHTAHQYRKSPLSVLSVTTRLPARHPAQSALPGSTVRTTLLRSHAPLTLSAQQAPSTTSLALLATLALAVLPSPLFARMASIVTP